MQNQHRPKQTTCTCISDSHDHIYIAFKKDVVLRPNKLLSCVCKILIPSNMSLDNSSPLSYYVQNRSIWLMFILLYWRLAYLITAVNRVFSVGIYLQNLITFNGCKHWPPDCPQSCNVAGIDTGSVLWPGSASKWPCKIDHRSIDHIWTLNWHLLTLINIHNIINSIDVLY